MHHMRCCAAALLLAAVFTSAVSMLAAPQAPIYDEHHKDYHKWNDREERAWRRFLAANHRKYHEFGKASGQEQQEYWDWRHSQ